MAVQAKTWKLTIIVPTHQFQKVVQASNTMPIGQIVLDLCEKLDTRVDWSDYGLWWPDKLVWITRPRQTLEHYGVRSDCTLHFVRMHQLLYIILPDLQIFHIKVNFSLAAFFAVHELCQELGIRHFEELSFCRIPETVNTKKSGKDSDVPELLDAHEISALRLESNQVAMDTVLNPFFTELSPLLINSPQKPNPFSYNLLPKSGPLHAHTQFQKGWVDSGATLMAQGILENDKIFLRFKYYCIFDLNPKLDAVRINQLYMQLRYSLITEDISVTEEELIQFAALQLQTQLASKMAESNQQQSVKDSDVDDIDSALQDLQLTLEGNSTAWTSAHELTVAPELKDTLSLLGKGLLSRTKKFFFSLQDTTLFYFKSKDDTTSPIGKVNLRDASIVPSLKGKLSVKIMYTNENSNPENMEIVFSDENQLTRWLAAIKLATKGMTITDPSYQREISGTQAILNLFRENGKTASTMDVNPEDLVPASLLKKHKSKDIAASILEAHYSYNNISMVEAKISYIRLLQSLPDYGLTHFLVKMKLGAERYSKKEDFIALSPNRIIKVDANRNILKEWRYSTIRSWNVNWETKEIVLDCDEQITISSPIADIDVIHEFLGGYMFLLTRSDVNAPLDGDTFLKLTDKGPGTVKT